LSRVVERCSRGDLADDGLASGGGLPWGDIDGSVAAGGHGLGLDAAGVMADAALGVVEAGDAMEPVVDGVAPDDGMTGLEGEEFESLHVALVVDKAMEALPGGHVTRCRQGVGIVGVIDMLDDGFPGVQDVVVGDWCMKKRRLSGQVFRDSYIRASSGGYWPM
jgi:hypothetical protein